MNIRVYKGRQRAKQAETKSSYDWLQGIEMDHQTVNQQDAGRTVTSEVTGISHNRNVQIAENRKKRRPSMESTTVEGRKRHVQELKLWNNGKRIYSACSVSRQK